jgi:hypothetical protein
VSRKKGAIALSIGDKLVLTRAEVASKTITAVKMKLEPFKKWVSCEFSFLRGSSPTDS